MYYLFISTGSYGELLYKNWLRMLRGFDWGGAERFEMFKDCTKFTATCWNLGRNSEGRCDCREECQLVVPKYLSTHRNKEPEKIIIVCNF